MASASTSRFSSRRPPLPDHSFSSTVDSRQHLDPQKSLSHSSSFSSVDSQHQLQPPQKQEHQPSSSTSSSSNHTITKVNLPPPLTVLTGPSNVSLHSNSAYGRGHSPDLQLQHHPSYRPYTPTTPSTPTTPLVGSSSLAGQHHPHHHHHQGGYATPTSPRFDAAVTTISSYPGGLHPFSKNSGGGRSHHTHATGVIPARRIPSNESQMVYDPYRSRQPGVSANKVKNDYRAQSPVREQFAMQQQQQHLRHGPVGSQHEVVPQRFHTGGGGYGSSSDDGLDSVVSHHEPFSRPSFGGAGGFPDHPPSSPVLSEHSANNYRTPLQYPQYHQHQQQQQTQPPYYSSQAGMEDRVEYNRVDPYRSAMSQQHPSSSSASSPFLGPQSMMMYHNNNNSSVSGNSQHGMMYDDGPSSYDSRLSMLGQHPARSHYHMQQQQHPGGFPLVLLDSQRSEGGEGMTGHPPSPHFKTVTSAGTEDRHHDDYDGFDDRSSEGARRARAAILAAHQGAAATTTHLARSGVSNNSTEQQSGAGNASGTATQNLIQGENKSSSTSGGSAGAGAGSGAAAAAGIIGINTSGSEGSKKKKRIGSSKESSSRHGTDSEDDDDGLEEGQEKGAMRRREPRCCFCLSRRACVYLTFLLLILLAVALFFLVPRMPIISFDGVRSDADGPTISRGQIEEPFMVRLRMDSKANWIPIRLNHLDLTMFYKLGLEKIANNDGMTKEITIRPRQVQFFELPMQLNYMSFKADLNADGVFQDLIHACKPIPKTETNVDVPGLNVQVQGELNVWGLAWVWKPSFTLEVPNMPCPNNARPPPTAPEESSTSSTTNTIPPSTASPTSLPSTGTGHDINTSTSGAAHPTSSARAEPTAAS